MIKLVRIDSSDILKPNKLIKLDTINLRPSEDLSIEPIGLKLVYKLENPHSLIYYDDYYLVCSRKSGNDTLYKFNSDGIYTIRQLGRSIGRTWYARVRDTLYISNGVYIYKYKGGALLQLQELKRSTNQDSKKQIALSDYMLDQLELFPSCKFITFFAGRLFGVLDRYICYSEPFFCDYMNKTNKLDASGSVVSLVAFMDRLYMATTSGVYVITIADPSDFILKLTKLAELNCFFDGLIPLPSALLMVTAQGLFIHDGQNLKKLGNLSSQFLIKSSLNYCILNDNTVMLSSNSDNIIVEGLDV